MMDAAIRQMTRPPGWLIAATGLLAVICLALAVAETTLWMHYLIDSGEYISLVGLAFILVAGLYLYRRNRLLVSLPLTVPWLLYPVITQGDQIIDNLSINAMRTIVQLLLAAIFATPVAVLVLAARYALAPQPDSAPIPPSWTRWFPGLHLLGRGRVREGTAILAAALFALELWVAHQYLGTLMVVTLILVILGTLTYGSIDRGQSVSRRQRSERFALVMLLAGVALSLGLYVGYKNRPGAYQGSPSFLMDPRQQGTGYQVTAIPVPATPPAMPSSPDTVREALSAYGRAMEKLLAGYYILDRNYTWDFHNELFLRQTPLLPNYRSAGLATIAEARRLREDADRAAGVARPLLADDDRLAALLDDLRAYVAFNFDRGPMLEQMSAGFEKTKAGLQHAAHLYEGEGKFLSSRLHEITEKHRVVLASPVVAPITSEFNRISQAVYEAYESRIVGF
jgi:hypothetical protein